MGDGVHISHIGLGEGTARIERGVEHIAAGLHIGAVRIGCINVFKDQLHGKQRVLSRSVCCGIPDISLHRVGQRVHTGGRGDKGRKTERHLRVQHCISRDQREIIDRVFVTGLSVRDHRRKGRLASGPRSRRNRHQERQPPAHLQDPFHFGKGFLRAGQACTDRFGAVHAGPAAEADDAVTVVFLIEFDRFRYIDCRRVRYCFIVDAVGNVIVCKSLFQTAGKSKFPDPGVRDDQRFGAFFLPDDFRQRFHTSGDLRFTVGQEGQSYFQSCLKDPAVSFFKRIHGNRSFLS